MIRIITNQTSTIREQSSLQDIINYFKDKNEISVDSETTSFSCHSDKVLTWQFGNAQDQFIVSGDVSIHPLRDLLTEKLLLLQNAKFDLRFLYKIGIFPKRVYDTYLAEVKLTQGLIVPRNLGDLAFKYCNTRDVDKSKRGLIHSQGLSETVLNYCANDVKYLPQIRDKQIEEAKKLNMLKAIELENRFVLALAYCEYCGIYLNPDKWIRKSKVKEVDLQRAYNDLNEFVRKNYSNFIGVDTQLDLFSNQIEVGINWSSEKQVKKLFKQIKINIKKFEYGIEKESIEEDILKRQKNKFPIIPVFIRYQKAKKEVTTYGINFLRHIDKNTNRIHTSYKQCVDTGRMSSGEKNRQGACNMQNLPRDAETRACFEAQDGYFIACDYSQQEKVILTNYSKDNGLISFYQSGETDIHSFTARKLYPELADLSLDDIKKNHRDKRDLSKNTGFCIDYGGSAYKIADTAEITLEEAQEIERAYFEGFPMLKEYYDKCFHNTLDNGYILIDALTGSKCFISFFDDFLNLRRTIKKYSQSFWEKYKVEKQKNSEWYKENKKPISKYYKWESEIRRLSSNYPIQGSGASIIKIAGSLFFEWIRENNLFNKVLITGFIHDEITVECKDQPEVASTALQQCMEAAGKDYCTIIPLKAVSVIDTVWKH